MSFSEVLPQRTVYWYGHVLAMFPARGQHMTLPSALTHWD